MGKMEDLDREANRLRARAEVLATVSAASKVMMHREGHYENGARYPQGSAYSHKWAQKGIQGKVRTAGSLSRTRRGCPTCLKMGVRTDTSDSFPYCPTHAIGPYRVTMVRGVISVLSGNKVDWDKFDEEEEARKAAAKKAKSAPLATGSQMMATMALLKGKG